MGSLEHDGYTLSFNAARTITLRADTVHHEFIGMNMDIEKTVDKHKIRICNTYEEDNTEECYRAIQENDVTHCSIHGIYFHKHMIIVRMHTPWNYTNPRTRIISARRVFYFIFKREPDPRTTFLAILEELDILSRH